MINSMTGFANGSAEHGSKRLYLELRAVNHRYLDIQFKMPEDLRHLEGALREAVSARAARGKIECRIQLQHDTQPAARSLQLNKKLVSQLAKINNKICRKHPDINRLGVADILAFPGVLAAPAEEAGDLDESVLRLINEVLESFNQARSREGAQLQQHLLQRLQQMEQILDALIKDSGTSVKYVKISKMGDKMVRKALYYPARAACLRSKLWRPWFEQKLKQGKHPKQIYVLMMCKIIKYAYAVIKSGQPFDENRHKQA
ncbi:hypothetical protein A7P95_10140 [Eikenella longinqua]|uniref:Uncharacterized protein n=1 Tax=Eikenella longinqua TaxID=1795827 RepID=A0A1A9RTH8_9NEIS|nr:YicC/YloC family endoribonuclease [Eikenella longinqua]OAM26064.1 hypothetical protein A7P95_10140 [Eikenella longinqua]